MKKVREWENKTHMHPKGVCEAAAMLWLSRLDNQGMEHALKLKASDCDALQALIEKGDTSWAVKLQDLLGTDSMFFPLVPAELSSADIAGMEPGDFLFVAGNGHAGAVYQHRDGIFFFNPGDGLFFLQKSISMEDKLKAAGKLMSAIKDDSMLGSGTAIRKGKLRHYGYRLDRFFGG
ncbi:hypothetical protein [Janthinobacterium sp. 1_2014MBL_MicDiv]|uniref:hypothetical protein n=1 Tax=Janthinobacterium sp. 1_2014MBL_MicDiv TaxID=1644131 RepID=UPI0012EB72AD|nr:hypothetical protein [Janthinobacterium sp. 1_2014MBL_MicDiv]